MRFEGLDLNLLVALEVLLEKQNVSAAAEQLCLSQSAMSGALSRLRTYFNDELLVPVGRQMMLTPRAESLISPTRNALILIRDTIASPAQFDPSTSTKQFKIATSDYLLEVLLVDAIRDITHEAPNISIDVSLLTNDASDKLDRGEIDFLMCVKDYMDSQHPSKLLFEEEHVLISCSENPYCQEGITNKLFSTLSHVTVSFGGNRLNAFIEQFYEFEGIKRKVVATAPYFGALPLMIVGTHHIATMLRRQAQFHAQRLPITIHELPIATPNIREYIQWHKIKDGVATQWLLEKILQRAQ